MTVMGIDVETYGRLTINAPSKSRFTSEAPLKQVLRESSKSFHITLTHSIASSVVFDGEKLIAITCVCKKFFKQKRIAPDFRHTCHFMHWSVRDGDLLEMVPTSRIPKMTLWLEFGRRLKTNKGIRNKWRREGGYWLPSWLSDTGKTEFIPCPYNGTNKHGEVRSKSCQ